MPASFRKWEIRNWIKYWIWYLTWIWLEQWFNYARALSKSNPEQTFSDLIFNPEKFLYEQNGQKEDKVKERFLWKDWIEKTPLERFTFFIWDWLTSSLPIVSQIKNAAEYWSSPIWSVDWLVKVIEQSYEVYNKKNNDNYDVNKELTDVYKLLPLWWDISQIIYQNKNP